MSSAPNALEVIDVEKSFVTGFFRKRVDAVRGVSFKVREGETFGILGPNGAGKTTTLKCALRLIRPTRGEVRIFGRPPSDRGAMVRVGYMPENPYVYQYLTPIEFLDLCGRLMGMDSSRRKSRIAEMLAIFDLERAKDLAIGKFSKGMTQRVGLAQALLHDPDLLILDEPMSGLDPIGRRKVRDILVTERERGKTLIFTSHILSDVETLCDHVVMIDRGRVSAAGTLDELLRPEVRRVEVVLAGATPALIESLSSLGIGKSDVAGTLRLSCEGKALVGEVLALALEAKAEVVSVTPDRETLEDLFVRNALGPKHDS